MNRIERVDGFYCDESGERFRQLFVDAEERREQRIHFAEIILAWVGLVTVCGVIWYGVLRAIGAL